MRLRTAARVILVGAPGVGKGTQSERLLQRFPQLQSISSGDLLRWNVRNKTALGIQVEQTLKAGGLVSDSIILRLINNELSKRGWLGRPQVMTLQSSAIGPDGETFSSGDNEMAAFMTTSSRTLGAPSDDPSASFLLDGFPRTSAQADQLDGLVPINLAVSIKTPFEVILERISGRWVHEPSGRVYNTTFNPPKVAGRDDITGEPLVRRADDDEETYRTRFKKFQEASEPLLDHYARKGVLYEVEGMSSDEISPKLFQEFEKRFCE
ncbi:adenylate kinase [Cryphonectria parasitica EP155]|uniref:GTP:AMP phosphotransferase, mitochondrial n=1 Tax=Cryphonectria parasitica (strain ATCC 38755 / EP155) TaxID=660469 RepID=A0A9P5CNU1_CRYP1|nr:adenylate kinase [Cryphonectria parasitica EP155]KAF3764481.1 adenylate kinase [Cryphonectria parasitica EP155]